MTVEQAVVVLNSRKHLNCSTWRFDFVCNWVIPSYRDKPASLENAEAIAIAEKYEQESALIPTSAPKS